MQLFFVFYVLAFLLCTYKCSPFFKDIDYKLYEHDNGIAIDSIFEIVEDSENRKHRQQISV